MAQVRQDLSKITTTERELNKHQRGMVDSCFEEGHYEQGIAMVDKLRLPHIRPSPSHTRQLIYIALYPPPSDPIERQNGRKCANGTLGSPSKSMGLYRDRQQKGVAHPLPAASADAFRVLSNLADCCTPESLTRALPGHPFASYELECVEGGELPKGVGGLKSSVDFGEDQESYISRVASELKLCQDCWEILKAEVITRPDAESQGRKTWSSGNRRKSRRSTRTGSSDDDEEEMDTVLGSLICKRAWPLLEWLVRIWEKEERMMEGNGRGRWSPSLFTQIKPARSGVGARTDVDRPLAVIFECYKSNNLRRQRLGSRLLSLLVNITTFPKLSHLNLLTSTTALLQGQLMSSLASIESFLSSLSNHPPSLVFKLCICDVLLTRILPGLSVTRPPPANRARAIATNGASEMTGNGDSGLGSSSCFGPWKVPTNARIFSVLEAAQKVGEKLSEIQRSVLAHYLEAYWAVGSWRKDTDGMDEDTARIVGRVKETIGICFSGEDAGVRATREMLFVMYS